MAKTYYVVESGIPIPDVDMTKSKRHYPWKGMEVGDSFLVPAHLPGNCRNAITAARHRGRDYGETYATRYVAEGMRVWRVK